MWNEYRHVIKEWNLCLVIKFGTPNEFANFSKTQIFQNMIETKVSWIFV